MIQDADHQYFTFEVSDSGIGIPEEALAHICERFYRVDKSHSREIGGTGLGLAITRSSIAMHHGIIKVSSKEGEGTTFTVKIPLSYIPSKEVQHEINDFVHLCGRCLHPFWSGCFHRFVGKK